MGGMNILFRRVEHNKHGIIHEDADNEYNFAVGWTLLRIREVKTSVQRPALLAEVFRISPQSLQEYAGIHFHIRTQRFHLTQLPACRPPIILLLDAI
jgi:hypothetical protein